MESHDAEFSDHGRTPPRPLAHPFVETADPSWYPRVLGTLARDYPEISDKVWSVAISENAAELSAKREQS